MPRTRFWGLGAVARRILAAVGYDLVPRSRTPRESLLGLASRPIRAIIDIGANEGQFAKEAARLFPEARLYCFEPQPRPYLRLSEWASCMGGRVHTFNVGLGETEATLDMVVHVEHDPSSSLLASTEVLDQTYPFTREHGTRSVRVAALDEFLERQEITLTPDTLIKIDVQGYENRVIKGGRRTFGRARACLLEVNLDPLYEGQATFRELFGQLDALGFRYAGNLEQVCGPDGHVIYLDALFIR